MFWVIVFPDNKRLEKRVVQFPYQHWKPQLLETGPPMHPYTTPRPRPQSGTRVWSAESAGRGAGPAQSHCHPIPPPLLSPSLSPTRAEGGAAGTVPTRLRELEDRASGLRVLTCSAGGARVAGKMCVRPPQLGKPGADNRAPPRPGGVEREGKRG